MTKAEMRASLLRLMRNRDTVTAVVADLALWNAYCKLCRGRLVDEERTRRNVTLFFPELEKTAELGVFQLDASSGKWYAAFPVDCDAPRLVYYAGDKLPRVKPVALFSRDDVDQEACAFDHANRRVYLSGSDVPTEAVWIVYYAKPAAWADDASEPEIPVAYHNVIPLIAARDLYNEFGEDERSRAFDAQIPHRLAELSTTRGLIDGFAPMPKL